MPRHPNVFSSDSNSFRKVPLETITKSAEKPAFLYTIYRNTQISAEFPHHIPTSVEGGNKVKIDFEVARQKIRLFDEFCWGKREWC